MTSKTWAFALVAGCCAPLPFGLGTSRNFYSSAWDSFQKVEVADRVGIAASVLGLFIAPIGTLLFWRFREIEALRAACDAADRRRQIAQDRALKLGVMLEAVEKGNPERILLTALQGDDPNSAKPEVIKTLEAGVLAVTAPFGELCRVLAKKLVLRGADGDLGKAERAARIANLLTPKSDHDLELQSILVELKVVEADKQGSYDFSNPAFAPVLTEPLNDPETLRRIINELHIRWPYHALRLEGLVAERMAFRALQLSKHIGDERTMYISAFQHANALHFAGKSEAALRQIDDYADEQAALLGIDHPEAALTRRFRITLLASLGQYQKLDEDNYGKRKLRDSSLGIPEGQETIDFEIVNPNGRTSPRLQSYESYWRAVTLAKLNQFEDAIMELHRFTESAVPTLGLSDPVVSLASSLRAEILSKLGREN